MTAVRDIKQDDLAGCAALYVKVFNGEPWNDKWTEETAFNRLADIANTPGFIGLVIEDEGESIGAVFGCMEQWYEGKEYSLREIFIKTERQSRGIGTKLMKELEARIREEGGANIVLFTSRETPAYRFYLKEGFHELGSMTMLAKNL